ncbi:MAG: nucleotidyltransferase family protein [Gemmatimonas sp.]
MRALSSGSALTASARASATNLNDPDFRDGFLQLADALRVRGLMLVRLEREQILTTLGEEASRTLASSLAEARRSAAALDLERERVLARLRRAGIEPVLLKGAALRIAYYDDAAERAVGDLDILVDASELDATRAVLVEAGYSAPDDATAIAYRRYHFHHGFRQPSGRLVEVHWALTPPEALAQLNARALADTAIPHARLGAPPVRVPRAEQLLLHLVVQNLTEPKRIFGRLVDIDRLAQRAVNFDWQMVVSASNAGGFTTALWFSMVSAQLFLDTPVPLKVIQQIQPPSLARLHLRRLDPIGRALAGRPLRDGQTRLLQLWLALGDHSTAEAVRWLLNEAFSSPVERERYATAGRLRFGTHLADISGLLANHLALYAQRSQRQ